MSFWPVYLTRCQAVCDEMPNLLSNYIACCLSKVAVEVIEGGIVNPAHPPSIFTCCCHICPLLGTETRAARLRGEKRSTSGTIVRTSTSSTAGSPHLRNRAELSSGSGRCRERETKRENGRDKRRLVIIHGDNSRIP